VKIARTAAWIWFVLLSLVSLLFGLSDALDETHPTDDQWLAATFGAGMALFGLAIAVTAFRRGERWAWIASLVWPVFLAVHVALFGTWVPDGVFCALSLIALAVTAPLGEQARAAVPA
jgi:hypothetical protein